MGKRVQQNRISNSRQGGVLMEQHTAIDDSLLPSAEELEKLKNIEPTIIEWILKRTEIEQNARLKFNEERVSLAKEDLKKIHRFNFTALVFGFLVFLIGMLFSAFFIYCGFPIQGTIFAGAILMTGVGYFVKASKNKEVK